MTATYAVGPLPVDGMATDASGRWAMRLLIVTEASFFAYLLFGYFYLGSMAPAWPPGGSPSLSISGPGTLVLLVSSGTMWWAERGIEQGLSSRLRLGLLATFLLGAVFLGMQSIEWSHQTVTPQASAYGSLFFTITGFHGAHVAAGLLMNLAIQFWAWRGAFSARRHGWVSNAALYWHFVDVVWIMVFASLYILPRFA